MVSSRFRLAITEIIQEEKLKESIAFEHFCLKFEKRLKEFSDELKEFQGHDESFSDFLREIRLDSQLGVRQMYEELLHLTSLYARKNEVFDIKNEIGEFSLPDRTMVLIKIKWLFENLLFHIIPEIENNLSFNQETRDEQLKMIKGNVDWHSTILTSMKNGEKFPLQFNCKINQVHFNTPENILAAYCILKLERDAKRILSSVSEEDVLRKKDFEILEMIKRYVHQIQAHSHLQELLEKMEKYSRLSLDSKLVRNLENKTRFRIRTGQITQKAYSDLLEWIEKYRGHNLPSDGRMLADFPFDHEKSIDILYQYWVFFKLIDYLVTNEKVRIIKVLRITKKIKGEEKTSFGGFILEMNHIRFKLLHEHEEAGWTKARSQPDFIVEYKGEFPIIMDPKNWGPETSEGSAYHKMLGYLHNFVEKQASVGILFFSSPKNYQIDEEGIRRNIIERQTNVGGKTIRFVTCIVHPKNSTARDINEVFNYVSSIIHEKLTVT